MIKIYLDWNVMSQMKNGNHADLHNILYKNEKLFLPYSTSHIGDIFSSFKETEQQNEYIKSDLDFISELTGNACLFNTGKEIKMEFYSPHELFQQRIDEKDLFKDISLKGLTKIFDEDESTKSLSKVLVDQLKSISIDPIFKAFKTPDTTVQMETIFPGLMENPTMEGFFNSFGEMLKGMNEDEKYRDLRKIVQSGIGISRDKIFNDSDPYKIIEKKYSALGTDWRQYIDNSKNAPEWFNEISNEYIMLDMHGYQEDNVNVKKGRKETFKNTTEDAFHAAFASTCHFYVINDNKSYNKTIQLFKKLGLKTSVFKPFEFVEYYNKYLKAEDETFNLAFPDWLIDKGQFVESKGGGETIRTYPFPYFLFGFFNILSVVIDVDQNKKSTKLLSQMSPSNNMIFVMEIQKLVQEMNTIFGEDIQKIGPVTRYEFQEEPWIGRDWKFGEVNYRLEKNFDEFQLFIDTEFTDQNKSNMIFNIYYINFPKVYEIKMMLSNIISLGGELQKESTESNDVEIRGKMGAKFLNFFGGEVEGKGKTTGSDSQKVLETFEIKTTKSIILNEIIEKSQSIVNFNKVDEGQLIKIDNVNLSLENEPELRTVKLIGSGLLKDTAIPGANGLDIDNAFNAMLKDYAYKMKGKIKNCGDEIIIKIPLTFESEFESSYSVDDLFIGRVSVVGLYKGKIRIDSLKNSFEFFNELGKSQKSSGNVENVAFQEVQDSHYENIAEDNALPLFKSSGDGSKEFHYIDLLAIVQNVNIPTKR